MSDIQDDRPLSRRERRLRELGDTSGIPIVAGGAAAEPVDGGPGVLEDEIVISPVDDSGRPRTRREMRELREQALAERAARAAAEAETQSAAAATGPAVSEPSAAGPVAAAPVAAAAATVGDDTQPIAPVVAEAEPAQDESVELDPLLAHTQPFTPADLAEATADAAEDASEADEVGTGGTADLRDAVEVDDEGVDADAADADDADDAEADAGSAKPVAAKPAYTFPDIAPLDEGISVFDDPALRTQQAQGAAGAEDAANFDDLISRAVAQEGAASAANTSALILPSMPDTGDLSGPLGETGELYITGSIELPRSLGETGGHAALLDSVESDPLDEIGFGEQSASSGGIAPVSAARAVSARASLGPVVTEAQKEKSKLPVVLIATGGGLVVAVVALLIWGATSGMFG